MSMPRQVMRWALVLGLSLGACLALPLGAAALETSPSSGTLVEQPAEYDGREVRFTGEAIGELMVRGDNAWIHLNDDAYMMKNVEEGAALGGYNSGMPVWLPKDIAGRISTFGDYKHEGDVVEVRGTFNAACSQHGGDMDIHATELTVRFPGRRAADPVKPWKVPLVGGLGLVVAGLWLAERRLGQRERRGLLRRR